MSFVVKTTIDKQAIRGVANAWNFTHEKGKHHIASLNVDASCCGMYVLFSPLGLNQTHVYDNTTGRTIAISEFEKLSIGFEIFDMVFSNTPGSGVGRSAITYYCSPGMGKLREILKDTYGFKEIGEFRGNYKTPVYILLLDREGWKEASKKIQTQLSSLNPDGKKEVKKSTKKEADLVSN